MSSPRIDGLTIGAALGEGAHARVWAAVDAHGREVAVKVLRHRDDELAASRLRREARVLDALEHPGIVRLLGAGETADGAPYLVMERLEGESLRERLAGDGLADEAEAWSVLRAVAEALGAAHSMGVLHRDVTSGNVIFDGHDRVRLCDFGLARRAADPTVSRDGASTGTPAYMAPEQWWGAGVDERTDVYGLGALLFEALTGTPPWEGEDPAELIHRVATSDPPSAAERGARLEVDRFLGRCLARSSEDRPRDVASFIREGDAVFGRRRRGFVEFEPWGWALAIAASPIVLTFGGTRAPLEWVREAGWGAWGVIAAFVLAVGLVVRRPASRAVAPLLPLLMGALAFETGMQMVRRHVERAEPELRFVSFHVGVAEASAGWFIGAALAGSALVWVAVREAGEPVRPGRVEIGLAAFCLLAGLLAGELGAIVTCALAGALVLRGASRRPSSALAAAGAIAAVALMSWVTLVSDAARLFDSELERAARGVALTRLAEARVATVGASFVAWLALVSVGRWRGVRAWSRRRIVFGAVGAALTLGALIVPWLSMEVGRRGLADTLSSHLSIWSELDPPSGPGVGPARLGPTLQIGRRRVTLDGEPVLPVAGLRSETGQLVLAQHLGAALSPGELPQLVVAADRATPWRTLEVALRVAHELGVRQVDVLLIPGDVLRPLPSAPPETAIVLPGDLRAFPLVLGAEGARIEGERPFAEVASTLQREGRVGVGR